ncbi:MAG: DUF72 domain-containing protein [Aquabacterium sp.]
MSRRAPPAVPRTAVRIGISGWRYEPWRGVFYPDELPQRMELAFASRALNSIEINGSFYSLQRPSSWQAWRKDVPEDFVFSVKGPRYITHVRRLNDVAQPLANFLASGLLQLGAGLGPLLWQFPPSLRFDAERFEAFLAMLPHDTVAAAALARQHDDFMQGRVHAETDARRPLRHAVEIRHDSFACDAFVAMLRRHGVALVVADTAGKWPFLTEVTTDFMYLRLHGDKELYASGYSDEALDTWANRIRGWSSQGQDIHVYFDNDIKVRAPFDAARLTLKLGLPHTLNADGHFEVQLPVQEGGKLKARA